MNSMNLKKHLLLWVLLGLLCSCGDETTKVVESKTLDYESCESIDDLPDCSEENEGRMVWVAEESQLRICADEKWYAMVPKDSSVQKDPKWNLSCHTEMNKDSTGYSVICNGDSIGFVRNGKLIESGKEKDDDECSVLFVSDDTLKIACDSLVSVLLRDSSGNLKPQEMELDSEQIALDLENIGGYSQKGPFVTGSEVTVYELQNGRTLKQTGKSFKGNITNDKGSFNVRTVKVASQYAYLVAKGVYLSEISGEKSDAQIQLSAITDLRNRNTANINLLTHLEYERVIYLVTQKKKTVSEAKKQAQKEIFEIFHVDTDGFIGSSEDFSMGGSGDEDAALLAISILLQKDDKTANLSKRVNTISTSIADSGSCDASMLLDLADWASRADSLGNFAQYRENVKKMGLSAKVADFEKYIRNFWNTEYGLGDCDTLGKIVAAKRGTLKDSASLFICEEMYGANNWRYLTTVEKELRDKKPAADGTLDTGASGNIYVYDSVFALTNGSGWRLTNNVESKHGLCSLESDGVVVSIYMRSTDREAGCYDTQSESQFYECDGKNRKWAVVEDCFVVDTYGWGASTDGDARFGTLEYDTYAGYREACYVFDSLDGAWRTDSERTCNLGVGGCTRARVGKYFEESSNYYRCREDLTWEEIPFYYERFSKWWVINNVWQYDCEPLVPGAEDSYYYFVCENGDWRLADDLEKQLGEPCFDQDTMSYSADSAYVCFTGIYVDDFVRKIGRGWKKVSTLDLPKTQREYLSDDLSYGSFVDSRDNRSYKTIKIGEDTWTAENMLYFDKWVMNDEKSCYGDSSSECEMWRVYHWPLAMNINGQYLSSSAKDLISESHRGICPEGWHIPSVSESEALLASAGSFKALLSAKRKILKSDDFEKVVSNQLDYSSLTFVTGSNTSGFSGICGYQSGTWPDLLQPGGVRRGELPEPRTCWWTSEEVLNTQAKAFCIGADEDFPLIEVRSKEDELPVRCVQDKKGEE